MNNTKGNATKKKQQWSMVIVGLNYFIPFQGLIAILKGYLKEDRLPLFHFFLIGLISAILGWGITVLTKTKSFKTQIAATALLLLSMIFLNFLIN